MSQTKTVQTTYGEVEVEVVECDSCGQEIEKEEAYYFIIRNTKNKDDFTGQTEGWACEYCVDNPISFPVIYRTLGADTDFADVLLILCLSFVMTWVIQIVLGVAQSVA